MLAVSHNRESVHLYRYEKRDLKDSTAAHLNMFYGHDGR